MNGLHFTVGRGAVKVLTIWISAAGIAATALVSALAGLITPWFLVGSTIVGIATIFAALWYPSRYVDVFSGSFDGMAVRATIGVIRRQEIFVPIKALRTFELCSDPVQRIFKCRTVILRFAGGAVYLPLLPETQAFQLAKDMEKYED